MGGFIYPELYFEILRPMVKDLAQLDLPFLSYGPMDVNFCCFFRNIKNLLFLIYGQITVNFCCFSNNGKNLQLFGHNSKMVSPIEKNPSP